MNVEGGLRKKLRPNAGVKKSSIIFFVSAAVAIKFDVQARDNAEGVYSCDFCYCCLPPPQVKASNTVKMIAQSDEDLSKNCQA